MDQREGVFFGMIQAQKVKRIHLRIHGQVQGVGYRISLKRQADVLSVMGWCRNLPTAHVEAEVFGSEEALKALIDWCHQGPPMARVTAVEVSEIPINADESFPSYFEIRHP